MVRSVEGIYLSLDYTHLITEKVAKTLFVDLNKWVAPYAYFDHGNKEIICNGHVPDGCYIILGKVSYPGKQRMSYHEVYQFQVAKNRGTDLYLYKPLNLYPELPKEVPLAPLFPLYRVGSISEYKEAVEVIKQLEARYFSIDQLKDTILNYPIDTVQGKVFRLRLALERYIRKEI